jgi:hypothetical protein
MQNKKPHTIAGTVILPAAIDMVQTMSLDGLLIRIPQDWKEQLTEKLRSKRFSIPVDEATDCSGIGHLADYVRYVEGATINEDTFFCKSIKRRATAKELVQIVVDFVEEKT